MCDTKHTNELSVCVCVATGDACLQRWRYSVDPTIRRGKWTVEEDGMLRQGVAQHGAKEWARWVPGHMNGRTAPQCRERWVNSLDPNKRAVIEAPWTAEEDAALVEAVELLGTEEVERGAAPGTPAAASDRPVMQGPLGEAP